MFGFFASAIWKKYACIQKKINLFFNIYRLQFWGFRMKNIIEYVSIERVFAALCFAVFCSYCWFQLSLVEQPVTIVQMNLMALSFVLFVMVLGRRGRKTLPRIEQVL